MQSAFGKPLNDVEKDVPQEKLFPNEFWWKNQPTIALSLGMKWFCNALVNGVKQFNFVAHALECEFPNRYAIVASLGLGRFSQCFRAVDVFTRKPVAIKCFHDQYRAIGQQEALILIELARVDHLKSKFVHAENALTWDGTFCIVFELMDGALSDFLPAFSDRNNTTAATATTAHGESDAASGSGMRRALSAFGATGLKREQTDEGLAAIVNEMSTETESEQLHVRGDGGGGRACDSGDGGANECQRPRIVVTVEVLRSMTRQLLFALDLCEQAGMIHGDVKPENILYKIQPDNSLAIKLGDFGNAVKLQHVYYYLADFEIQSLQYRAPEVSLGVTITPRIDIWSLGCTLYCIFFKRPLFDVLSREALIARMTSIFGPLPIYPFSSGMYYSTCYNAETNEMNDDLLHHEREALTDTDSLNYATLLSRFPLLSPGSVELASLPPPSSLLSPLTGQAMLWYDPQERITPFEALHHQFLSLDWSPYAYRFMNEKTRANLLRYNKHRMWGPSSHLVYQTLFGEDTKAAKIEFDESHSATSISQSIPPPAFSTQATATMQQSLSSDEEFGRAISRKTLATSDLSDASSDVIVSPSKPQPGSRKTAGPSPSSAQPAPPTPTVPRKPGRPRKGLLNVARPGLPRKQQPLAVSPPEQLQEERLAERLEEGEARGSVSDAMEIESSRELLQARAGGRKGGTAIKLEQAASQHQNFATIEREAVLKLRTLSVQYRQSTATNEVADYGRSINLSCPNEAFNRSRLPTQLQSPSPNNSSPRPLLSSNQLMKQEERVFIDLSEPEEEVELSTTHARHVSFIAPSATAGHPLTKLNAPPIAASVKKSAFSSLLSTSQTFLDVSANNCNNSNSNSLPSLETANNSNNRGLLSLSSNALTIDAEIVTPPPKQLQQKQQHQSLASSSITISPIQPKQSSTLFVGTASVSDLRTEIFQSLARPGTDGQIALDAPPELPPLAASSFASYLDSIQSRNRVASPAAHQPPSNAASKNNNSNSLNCINSNNNNSLNGGNFAQSVDNSFSPTLRKSALVAGSDSLPSSFASQQTQRQPTPKRSPKRAQSIQSATLILPSDNISPSTAPDSAISAPVSPLAPVEKKKPGRKRALSDAAQSMQIVSPNRNNNNNANASQSLSNSNSGSASKKLRRGEEPAGPNATTGRTVALATRHERVSKPPSNFWSVSGKAPAKK